MLPVAPAPQVTLYILSAKLSGADFPHGGRQVRIDAQLHIVQRTVITSHIVVDHQLEQFAHRQAFGPYEIAGNNFAQTRLQ